MKSYRGLLAAALGLFFVASMVGGAFADAHMACPSCKAAIPTGTKPVIEQLAAAGKCSMCGMEMAEGTEASKIACPACQAELTLCGMCAKAHEAAGAETTEG